MWYFSGTLNKQCGYIDEKVARNTLEDVLGMGFFIIERTGDYGTGRHYGKNLLTFGNFLKSLHRFFPRHRNNTAIIIIMELVEQIKYNLGIYIRGFVNHQKIIRIHSGGGGFHQREANERLS